VARTGEADRITKSLNCYAYRIPRPLHRSPDTVSAATASSPAEPRQSHWPGGAWDAASRTFDTRQGELSLPGDWARPG
jgi:hypothetical protein